MTEKKKFVCVKKRDYSSQILLAVLGFATALLGLGGFLQSVDKDAMFSGFASLIVIVVGTCMVTYAENNSEYKTEKLEVVDCG
jgi:hypothetical protein